MKHFKEALAFPMFAASAWLIWVLSQQSGSRGLAEGLAGLLMIAIAAWLNGQVHPRSNSGRRVTNFLTAIVVLTACGLLANIQTTTAAATSASAPVSETFSDQRLAELEASGTPTFVDMTAAWCLTCLVNERVAIASGAVQSAFQRDHIVYLKGDWTQQDPVITRFLEQHGSDGVPLYVFFPGHRHNTIVLPQILTPAIILRAVDKPPTEGD